MTSRPEEPRVSIEGIIEERRAQVLALPQWTLLRAGWMPESGKVQGGVFYRVGEGLGPAGRDEYHTDVLRRAVSGSYDRPWGIEVLAGPRVAVVRPTRREVEVVIANVLYSDAAIDRLRLIAEALLARFDVRVAVSDSQETPQEGL